MGNEVMVTQQYNISDLVNLAVAFAFIAAMVLSVIYMFVGGISFILSGGQEDKIRQAVNTIRYAIFGLFFTFISLGIIQVVGLIFDFDLLSILSWDRISSLMGELIDRIFNSGGGGSNLPSGTGTLR